MAGSLIQELKRRNVFRVAIVYVVVCWLLMQIGDVMFPALRLPDWTPTLLVAFLILGFPLVVVFAWAFELTPDGMVRTTDVPEGHSITTATGRRINYVIIGVLALAVAFLLARDALLPDRPDELDVIVADHSIAVLPFKNQSASAENAEFFAGGLHDELLTLLSRLGQLRVISRTSVERLDPDLSIREIGKLLDVSTVLEGQVQRAGQRLRINVQLIDTVAEGHLWANTYDSELTAENVFDVQSDIARTIANALQAELSADDEKALTAVPTTNTAALEKYLMAMQIGQRRTFEALRRAEDYLDEAVAIDPEFSEAWAALAHIHGELFMTGAIGLQEYTVDAGSATSTALSLDPRNAEAIAEQARVLHAAGDFDAADKAFRRALEITPRNAMVLETYGEVLRIEGKLERARDVLSAGLEYDPLSPQLMFQLGRVEMFLGNPARNLELAQRMLDIDPLVVHGYVAAVQANLWRGRYDLAFPWYIRTVATDAVDHETWAHLALFFEELGSRELSDRYMARAESLDAEAPVVVKCRVMILTNRGRFDDAAALADRMLVPGFDNRWESDRVLLRTIRDRAIDAGELERAIERYRQRVPELLAGIPEIGSSNVNAAPDLALLLRLDGREGQAGRLLENALQWYDETQPSGVYGYLHGTLKANLLATSGEHDRAMATLLDAVDNGYRWQLRWETASRNFDPLRSRPEFQLMLRHLDEDMAGQLENILASPHLGDFDLRDKPAK